MSLTGFEVLARGGGRNVASGDRVVVICHIGGGAGSELAEGCEGFVEIVNQGSGNGKYGLGRGNGKALVDADARG